MFLVHKKIMPPAQKLVEFVFVKMSVLRVDDMNGNHAQSPDRCQGIVAARLKYVTCPIGQLTQSVRATARFRAMSLPLNQVTTGTRIG